MDIKEKAELYDKAIEIARKNYKAAENLCDGSKIGVECFKNTLSSIFPELKENKGEQNLADKIEPKFKVGDWILYSGDHYEGVRHITKINKNGYYIKRNGLPHGIIPFNHERCMRLWTINDAKDGDVLATKDTVFIFKHIDKAGLSLCKSYCEVIGNSELGLGFDFSINNVHPATKEQRELLFQKMKENGYEWDDEKKELKEIEQKSYGQRKECLDCQFNYAGECKGSCAIKRSEQEFTWSKEDERMLDEIIDFFENGTVRLQHDLSLYAFWLKSLKPHNKWKPSED